MPVKIDDITVYNHIKNHLIRQNEQSKMNLDCSYFSVDDSYRDKIKNSIDSLYTDEYLLDQIEKTSSKIIYNGRYYYMIDHDDDFESLRNAIVDDLVNDEIKNGNAPTKSCAVGCLISKEYYTPRIEHSSVIDGDVLRIVSQSNPQWEIGRNQIKMLKFMQNIHDMFEPSKWGMYFDLIDNNQFFFDGYFNTSIMAEKIINENQPEDLDLERFNRIVVDIDNLHLPHLGA